MVYKTLTRKELLWDVAVRVGLAAWLAVALHYAKETPGGVQPAVAVALTAVTVAALFGGAYVIFRALYKMINLCTVTNRCGIFKIPLFLVLAVLPVLEWAFVFRSPDRYQTPVPAFWQPQTAKGGRLLGSVLIFVYGESAGE